MVMDAINLLIVSGALERVALRFREDGTPVCTGTIRVDELGAQGTVFKTYVPFEGYAKCGEALGARHEGDVMLLQGKVFWRKYTLKSGEEKSGLALLVQKASVLVPAPVPVATGD